MSSVLPKDINLRRLFVLGAKLFKHCTKFGSQSYTKALVERQKYLSEKLGKKISITQIVSLCELKDLVQPKKESSKFNILLTLNDTTLEQVEEILSELFYGDKVALTDDIIELIIGPYLQPNNNSDEMPFEDINLDTEFVREGKTLGQVIFKKPFNEEYTQTKYVIPTQEQVQDIVNVLVKDPELSAKLYDWLKFMLVKDNERYSGITDPARQVSFKVFYYLSEIVRMIVNRRKFDVRTLRWFFDNETVQRWLPKLIMKLYKELSSGNTAYKMIDTLLLSDEVRKKLTELAARRGEQSNY